MGYPFVNYQFGSPVTAGYQLGYPQTMYQQNCTSIFPTNVGCCPVPVYPNYGMQNCGIANMFQLAQIFAFMSRFMPQWQNPQALPQQAALPAQSPMAIKQIADMNGSLGRYGQIDSSKLNDKSSIAYGRNSTDNFNGYLDLMKTSPFGQKPPLEYEQRYLPEEKVDPKKLNKMALLGSSYEDMGARSISVAELNKSYKAQYGDNACVDAYDINKDGKIDVAENAVATLIADMMDNQNPNDTNMHKENIDGVITNTGVNNAKFMLDKNNVENNRDFAKQIYKYFNLGQAQNKFLGFVGR